MNEPPKYVLPQRRGSAEIGMAKSYHLIHKHFIPLRLRASAGDDLYFLWDGREIEEKPVGPVGARKGRLEAGGRRQHFGQYKQQAQQHARLETAQKT